MDTTDWFKNARCHTTQAVADTLHQITVDGWAEKSFEISNAQGDTELAVGLIPVYDHDLDYIPGTLSDTFETLTMPEHPGWYISTVDADGNRVGYEYATEREARTDYDYLRSRY